MEANALALVVVLVAGLALAGLVVWHSRRPPCIGRRVIVNLDDGTALRGVLTGGAGAWLVLFDADLLRPHEATASVRLDGAAYIERSRVTFLQAVP